MKCSEGRVEVFGTIISEIGREGQGWWEVEVEVVRVKSQNIVIYKTKNLLT